MLDFRKCPRWGVHVASASPRLPVASKLGGKQEESAASGRRPLMVYVNP